MSSSSAILENLPGISLALGITALAQVAVLGEKAASGSELLDGLVIAIILGTVSHTVFGLRPALKPGIAVSSKTLLEVAIVLL